jgi:hypothetical protein
MQRVDPPTEEACESPEKDEEKEITWIGPGETGTDHQRHPDQGDTPEDCTKNETCPGGLPAPLGVGRKRSQPKGQGDQGQVGEERDVEGWQRKNEEKGRERCSPS